MSNSGFPDMRSNIKTFPVLVVAITTSNILSFIFKSVSIGGEATS